MDQEAELASQKISGKKIKKGYYLKPAEAIKTDVIIDLWSNGKQVFSDTYGDHENFNQIARRYCTERIPCNKSLYNNELLRQSGLEINASIGTINVISS